MLNIVVEKVGKREYVAKLGAWTANAKTPKEAQDSLLRKIESGAREAFFHPEVLTAYGHMVIVWSNWDGTWSYAIDPSRYCRDGHPEKVYGMSYDTKQECWRHARLHLAQMVYRYGGPDGLDVVAPEDYEQHASWVQWQNDCHRAKEAGLNDKQARAYATARQYSHSRGDFDAQLRWAARMEGCEPFECPPELVPGQVPVVAR